MLWQYGHPRVCAAFFHASRIEELRQKPRGLGLLRKRAMPGNEGEQRELLKLAAVDRLSSSK